MSETTGSTVYDAQRLIAPVRRRVLLLARIAQTTLLGLVVVYLAPVVEVLAGDASPLAIALAALMWPIGNWANIWVDRASVAWVLAAPCFLLLGATVASVAALVCAVTMLVTEQTARSFGWSSTQGNAKEVVHDLPDPMDPVQLELVSALRQVRAGPDELDDLWEAQWRVKAQARAAVVLGERVLVAGDEGNVRLLDRQGRELERRVVEDVGKLHYLERAPGGGALAVWGQSQGKHGIAALLTPDGVPEWRRTGDLRLVVSNGRRLAAADGLIVCSWSENGRAWYATPTSDKLLAAALGEQFYVVGGSWRKDADWFACLDAHTGRIAWRVSLPHETVACAGVAPGRILVSGLRGTLALSVADGNLMWLSPTQSALPPLVDGDHAILTTPLGELVALDLVDGQVQWRAGNAATVGLSSAARMDGAIVAERTDGWLYAVDPLSGGELSGPRFSPHGARNDDGRFEVADRRRRMLARRPQALGDGRVLTLDDAGTVWALARRS